MKLLWRAFYYDGKTANRHEVEVTLARDHLLIRGAGVEALWSYSEIKGVEGATDGPARLVRGDESLVVSEEGFIAELRPFARGDGYQPVRKPANNLFLISIGVILAGLFGVSMYTWVIPRAAAFAAENMPPSVEEKLGDSMVGELEGLFPGCDSKEAQELSSAIVGRLDSAARPHPYSFKVHILKSKNVNAFAAPGGRIIVFSGLIEAAKTPEEYAGVLSHEMEHVLLRHTTKMMFRDVSFGALVTLLLGDFRELSGVIRATGNMGYSRALEEEADTKGAELLVKAGIDPNGMVAFFEDLEKKEGRGAGADFIKYLSTHPRTEERVSYLKRHISGLQGSASPLLAQLDWEKVKMSCSPPSPPPGTVQPKACQ